MCRIHKSGMCVRIDTTLLDFNDMKWERGDISFIYNGNDDSKHKYLIVLDNKQKVYQKLKSEVN